MNIEQLRIIIFLVACFVGFASANVCATTSSYTMRFEPSDPADYVLTPKQGGRITKDASMVISGKGSLLGDTRNGKGLWREFFRTDPRQLPLKNMKKGRTYSVEFDYRMIDITSPHFFYLFVHDKGNRTLMRWTTASGNRGRQGIEEYDKWTVSPNEQGHMAKVFTAYRETPWDLVFGTYGPGAIVIDNLRLREWDSKNQAQQILAAERLTPVVMKKYLSSLRQTLSCIPQNRFPQTEIHQRKTASRLAQLDNSLKTDSPTLSTKLKWKKGLDEVRRNLFKLKVVTESEELKNTTDKPCFLAFVENALQKVRRDADYPYQGKSKKVISLSAAGNEYESFQLIVMPLWTDLKDVVIEITDLRNGDSVLPAEQITWHPVGYVQTTKPPYPVEYAGFWPDPLLPAQPITISSSQYVQPFWVTVHIPSGTKAGIYEGKIRVKTSTSRRELHLKVRVWDFDLPKRSKFRTAFGCWGSRSRKAREHLLQYRISPLRFGDARIIRKKNGDIHLDFSQFDPILEEYLNQGLSGFTFGPYWGRWRTQKFTILPEGSDTPETIELTVMSEPFKKFMRSYFRQWAAYLKKKGLLKMAYCYIYDEPGKNETDRVNQLLQILHEADPGLKAVIPGIPAKKKGGNLFPNLKIMCPITNEFDYEFAKEMQQEGRESWWYICLSPRHPYPNFFMDYPGIDHRILFWMSWKYNVEGLLYWQTIFWRFGNPWENPETYPTVHGDGCLMYPDPNDSEGVVNSIRLEMIRDGIEDYDYFVILKRLLNHLDTKDTKIDQNLLDEAKQLLSVPEEIVTSTSVYTQSPQKILNRRNRIGNIIERLNVLGINKQKRK